MSFEDKAARTLLKKPKPVKNYISFYESTPGKQIQIDTFFFKKTDSKDGLIPILTVVDVATRYTRFYLQKAKNDPHASVLVKQFIDELELKFPTTKDITVVSDDAKELVVKGKHGEYNITHKLATSFNKAVLAENAIRLARLYLRKIEARFEMLILKDESQFNKYKINESNLQMILDKIANKINLKAKIRKQPKEHQEEQAYILGDPVFLINLDKYFPYQTKNILQKKSYHRPWFSEPYYISKIINVQGIYKYKIRSYKGDEDVKYYYYTNQLQPIPPDIAHEYITKWINSKIT